MANCHFSANLLCIYWISIVYNAYFVPDTCLPSDILYSSQPSAVSGQFRPLDRAKRNPISVNLVSAFLVGGKPCPPDFTGQDSQNRGYKPLLQES